MMTRHDEVQLTPFCEIVGTYNGLHRDDYHLYVKIGHKMLLFTKGSKEAEIAQTELKSDLIGKKIALLCSDDPAKPLLIRIIEKFHTKGAHKT